MKTLICSALACLVLVLAANAQAALVSLSITGSWTAADYDVSSTGPTAGALGIPEENDDLVFGTAPSAGSTTFTLLVNTAGAHFFPTGALGVTHDWYGYTNVILVGTHTFGSASWVTSDILTGLVGPGGATAALWTNTDISVASPTLLSFRMFGSWEGSNADMFIGSRTATTIGTQFLLWEYFGGEEIRSRSYSASSVEDGPQPAKIDIKPGSCPNAFNVKLFEFAREGMPKKGGVLPVALLGDAGFDVNDVDVTTLALEGVAPLDQGGGPKVDDVATPVGDNANCNCAEDGPDGFDDLKMKFSAQQIAAAIPQGQPGDDLMLTLTGELLDGTPFEAKDCIHFVGGVMIPVVVGPPPGPVLSPAAPNPFNPVTRIEYYVPEDARVQLVVYNVKGQLVATLVNGPVTAGEHIVTWDAANAPSGIYFYRLTVGDFRETRKMILLK